MLHSHPDQHNPPGPPDWTPPSAQFDRLVIDAKYLLYKGVLMNKWLSNSSTALKTLGILGVPECVLTAGGLR